MRTKIMDGHTMRRMSEFRVRFGHCGRLFLSPAIYKIASTKIIAMSGSVFQASSNFRNASTNAIHMSWLT